MLRYLLDTNIVIYVVKRRPVEVMPIFNANAGRMAISAITLSELMHGAEKSSKVSENLAVIEDFCSRLEVLPYGSKAAQHYGAIRAGLEKIGQPMGVNDLHIAAHARSEGLVMVTHNVGEFARVPALQVENWVGTNK
ncbi:tRNA(fMet)-specific endonuclease VapC [Acidovorax sp. JG5]|jgi:tRNA(fMet)-specific endonuclease VapC|uniref:type II toxin-antitoxin system tRNA(fMet)-specific endonuclease VapC n=1 Tax=Acidovorax sp. JG5 TaxID=2822718 RepID=UPI001B32E32A|nr:tRNA(fMet)-specific endonuclease VapC [Acidovorax sp. JG5]MBP3979315.1 tRNA(fMet)-specific endonuclease VapC [Acidovorax sp. JG5]